MEIGRNPQFLEHIEKLFDSPGLRSKVPEFPEDKVHILNFLHEMEKFPMSLLYVTIAHDNFVYCELFLGCLQTITRTLGFLLKMLMDSVNTEQIH